jgi:hypothetical protein
MLPKPQYNSSINDHPFGMLMPGRSYSSTAYKYGFNGQEKDDEVYGVGNLNTAQFWEYDTRLGRRWNIDPIVKHWESGYATFHNNSILFTDVLGLDPVKKYSLRQRLSNFFHAKGYMNRANKYAVDNKIDDSQMKFGKNQVTINEDRYISEKTSKPGESMTAEYTYLENSTLFKRGGHVEVYIGGAFRLKANLIDAKSNKTKSFVSDLVVPIIGGNLSNIENATTWYTGANPSRSYVKAEAEIIPGVGVDYRQYLGGRNEEGEEDIEAAAQERVLVNIIGAVPHPIAVRANAAGVKTQLDFSMKRNMIYSMPNPKHFGGRVNFSRDVAIPKLPLSIGVDLNLGIRWKF